MRNFSWKYFAVTGDVDAYMLYKEVGSEAEIESAASGELIDSMELPQEMED